MEKASCAGPVRDAYAEQDGTRSVASASGNVEDEFGEGGQAVAIEAVAFAGVETLGDDGVAGCNREPGGFS